MSTVVCRNIVFYHLQYMLHVR